MDSPSLLVEIGKYISFSVRGFRGERQKWGCFWIPLLLDSFGLMDILAFLVDTLWQKW